jgi:hypothetical protein
MSLTKHACGVAGMPVSEFKSERTTMDFATAIVVFVDSIGA